MTLVSSHTHSAPKMEKQCNFFSQHSCVKARVNGKEGVIVAGGSSDADPALTLVEFFDLSSSTWISLGRLREGRRFPGKKTANS